MNLRGKTSGIYVLLLCLALPLVGACAAWDASSTGEPPGEPPGPAADPLSAWSDTAVKRTILEYLEQITRPGDPRFIPPEHRLATFDFDGTIGCEKPDYMEVMVAIHRLCELTRTQPALLEKSLYRAACDGDLETVNASVEQALLEAFLGETQTFYSDYVKRFLHEHHHPRFDRPYAQLTYLPMRQLIELLHARGFAVYVVSGSQQGFTRRFGTDVLELPAPRLIGSPVQLSFSLEDDTSALVRQDAFLSPSPDGAGKAEIIRNRIGLQPVLAFGNSMGDFEMLQYATSSPYPSLGLILVHDDPEEYVYRDDKLIQHAEQNGWLRVSMKDDFEVVFAE
ncbi:MAG: HAD family hydrolase [Acidobacteriota bacterium]